MSKGYSNHFSDTQGSLGKEPDYYIGPNGKALPGQYKGWIGVSKRESLLKQVKDVELKNAVNQLYRPGSFIGDGGTASVLKFESRTGLGLGKLGKPHVEKGWNNVRYIDKILKKQGLSNSDRKLAQKLRKELLKALGGFKK